MSSLKIYDLSEGVRLALVKSTRFKSVVISVKFYRNLKKDEVSKYSLLSNVLMCGCKKYKTLRDISIRTDELYGLNASNYTMKVGEKLVSTFRFSFVSDKYLDEPIFDSVFEFCKDILFEPIVVDDCLNPDVIEIEKQNLIDEIKSKIDSKSYYARYRCIENMCKNEPYSIDELGYVEDIKKITPKDLYVAYKEFLSTSRVYISIEGDFSEDRALEIAKNNFVFERCNVEEINRERYDIVPKNTIYIEENLNSAKANLCIGYRACIDYKDKDMYYALMVGKTIFGGGSNSKLFNDIREKRSLCYFIGASLNKYKSIILVNAGIDKENYKKVLDLVRKNLEEVQAGIFSCDEINYAKKILINDLKSSYTSFTGESGFAFNQEISGTNYNIDEVIDAILNVNKEDIMLAMKKVVEDTVYLLK